MTPVTNTGVRGFFEASCVAAIIDLAHLETNILWRRVGVHEAVAANSCLPAIYQLNSSSSCQILSRT